MHYEMVSPVEVHGRATYAAGQSADGTRIRIGGQVGQGHSGTGSYNANDNIFVAERRSSGWVTVPMNQSVPDSLFGQAMDASFDLGTAASLTARRDIYNAGGMGIELVGLDGSSHEIMPVLDNLAVGVVGGFSFQEWAATPDFSSIVFGVIPSVRLLASDGAPFYGDGVASTRLYELVNPRDEVATLRRVDLGNDGLELAPNCGANISPNGTGSNPNEISTDGSKVIFSARTGQPCSAKKAFVRVDGTSTVELSQSECVRVSPACVAPTQGAQPASASANGDRVAVVTSNQLTDSDDDLTSDLYVYDFGRSSEHHLVHVSLGNGTAASFKRIVQFSDDGSRIYFVAGGAITSEPNSFGASALPAGDNLYVYDFADDGVRFIGQMTGTSPQGGLSDDAGDALIFTTNAPLGGGDADSVSDVYRFDAVTSQLSKVSPGNASEPATIPPQAQTGHAGPIGGRSISRDGTRGVFRTVERLSVDDVNGKPDAYLWHSGGVELIADGQDPEGSAPLEAATDASISADGTQVTFTTVRRLVPEDGDDVRSAYVARLGPDFARDDSGRMECAGDDCQGLVSDPFGPLVPASSSLIGGGDRTLPRVSIRRVGRLSASSRSRLARGKRASLRVWVAGSGVLSVRGDAAVGGEVRRVVARKVSVAGAGAKSVPLRLSAPARRELRRRGRLGVKLVVGFGQSRQKTIRLDLRAPSKSKGGRS
jgi:hypothetical protein